MDERVMSRQGQPSGPSIRAVVAIPVRNEVDRIASCLRSLDGQLGMVPGSYGILLFLNNCTDATEQAVAWQAARMSCPVRVLQEDDPQASAGWARRRAMDAAATWLAEVESSDDVILTTDADSRVESDWLTRNLGYIAAGADAVAGTVILDAKEAAQLPAGLHARGRLETQYETLLAEIDARLDPDPGNPWPRHRTCSGATIAVRRCVYHQVGGLPDLPLGEDRAFIEALQRQDFRVRQASDIRVVTSGRLDGRAPGGAADTMKLRCEVPDSPCDDRLERLDRAVLRTLCRRILRHLHGRGRLNATARLWAPALLVPRRTATRVSTTRFFGEAFAAIAAASPRLAYRPLRPSGLVRQISRAKGLLRALTILERARRGRPLEATDPLTPIETSTGERCHVASMAREAP